MTLPLAIHTARQGYIWLNASQHDLSLLERFRKAIGRMPDLDYGASLSCGVLNDGEWVVVYRFMVEKKGDFLGRDCLYLALTWFQRSIAGSVNISRLLEMPVFTATVCEPPSSFEYDAGVSSPCACDPAAMSDAEWAGLDFTQAGSAFRYPFAGTLRITQEIGSKIVMIYSEVAPLALITEQVWVEESPVLEVQDNQPVEKVPCKKRVRYIGWSVAAAALLIVAWMLDRKTAKQRQGGKSEQSSIAVITDANVAASSIPIDTPLAKAAKDGQGTKHLCRVPAEVNRQLSEWQYGKANSIMQTQFFWRSYSNPTHPGLIK